MSGNGFISTPSSEKTVHLLYACGPVAVCRVWFDAACRQRHFNNFGTIVGPDDHRLGIDCCRPSSALFALYLYHALLGVTPANSDLDALLHPCEREAPKKTLGRAGRYLSPCPRPRYWNVAPAASVRPRHALRPGVMPCPAVGVGTAALRPTEA